MTDMTGWIKTGDTQNFVMQAPEGSSGDLCEVEGDPDRYLYELLFPDESIPPLLVDRYDAMPPGVPGANDAERLAAIAEQSVAGIEAEADAPVERLESGPAEGQTAAHVVALTVGGVHCLMRVQLDFFGKVFIAHWQGPAEHADMVRASLGTFDITL